MTRPEALRCEEVIERLFAYLDEELAAGDQAAVRHHIEECRDCCSRAEFELLLRRRLGELGTESPPQNLRQRLRTLLDSF